METRLRTALASEASQLDPVPESCEQAIEQEESTDAGNGIVTTEQELEGYFIVKAIVRSVVAVERIFARDTKTYFGVLLDDNNRKPICRLHFNRTQKYVGLFAADKKEERYAIASLDDLYGISEKLRETVSRYTAADGSSAGSAVGAC